MKTWLQQQQEKTERNAEIFRRFMQGEPKSVLAREFGLGQARVSTIIAKEKRNQESVAAMRGTG
jgi:Mor family transcriptional regulator